MNADFDTIHTRVHRFIQHVCSLSYSEQQMHRCAYAGFDDEFNNLACELFKLQFAYNTVYQRYCTARGVYPKKVTAWHQIPAMPTAAFKDFDVTCLKPSQWTTVFFSSGTTSQKPSKHFHSPNSLKLYEASVLPWLARHLLPETLPSDTESHQPLQPKRIEHLPLFFLTPTRAEAPCSSLVYMFETVRRAFGSAQSEFFGRLTPDGSWQVDTPALCAVLRNAVQTKTPVALLGTAFAFVHLLDYMETHKLEFNLPPGSRVLETGGYKGRVRAIPKTELYKLITARLGVPESYIIAEYGMCELSSQAYDAVVGKMTNRERLFQFPPWVRTQIVSPETGYEVAEGQTGLIRVFDIANVFSVLAVQTEDLAVRRGTGFELLGRAPDSETRGCSLLQLP